MATFKQIIYNVRNLYRGGLSSDDDPISDRQILFMVNTHRAFLLDKESRTGRSMSRTAIQDLGCIEMECVDAAECCEIGATGTTILKSKKKLPAFLSKNGVPMITYAGSVDLQNAYQVSNSAQTHWSKYNKYSSKSPRLYIDGSEGHIYGVNLPNGIEVIRVKGVLNQPQDIKDFLTCPDGDCFSLEDNYPIGEEMIPVINDMIVQKDMRLLVSTPQDRVNDTKPTEDQPQRRV